jgi:uncharacterized damage-inducible protein DinB
MRRTDVAVVFDYLFWMRDRILNAAAELSPAEFVSGETITVRDLRGTLVHELDVEWSWRERLRDAPPETWGPEAELRPDDYPTLEALADHWRRDEAEMRGWVETLTDEQLAAAPPGAEDPLPLWYYVMHLLSHAIQQCSEAAVLLTRAGHSPGGIGFLEWADSRRTAAATAAD